LNRAGVPSEIPRDIHVALWEKFLLIAPLGGVGAVTRAPVGTLRALPGTRRMLERGMREILDVARARGVPLDGEAVARTMALLDSFPANGTISLQRDIAAGRPSELEAWNGAVVRLGNRAGVPVPLHEFLYGSLLPLERNARGEEKFPE
jgi:2-dehydropantoate 2-reductase